MSSNKEITVINGIRYIISNSIPNLPLIKDIDNNYYNIGKLCRQHGKRLFSYDTSDWFKELTKKILNQIYPNDVSKTYADLHYEIKPGKNIPNTHQGTYAHELYLIPLLTRLSNETSFLISNVYSELQQKYRKLKEEYKKSNENIYELTTPINRNEKLFMVITKLNDDNVYRINNSKHIKTEINNEKVTTIPYINCDDVYNIFTQTLRTYQELDCVTKIKGQEYIISDIDRFKSMINEIKYNTFDINNYGIDTNKNIEIAKQKIIEKLLSNNCNKTCMVGLLYEHFCLQYLKEINKHDDIHLWKFLPQTFLNDWNVNRMDYGKDIVDIKNKCIYQCKYYPNSELTMDNLYTFISEAEKYNDRGFKSYLICPRTTELSQLVDDKFSEHNIDIINYDAEDMLEFLKNNDIKLSYKIFNLNKYLEFNINKPFEELLKYVREHYKSNYKEETLKTMIRRLQKNNPELVIEMKSPNSKIRKELIEKHYDLSDIELQRLIETETNDTFSIKSVERIRRNLNAIDPIKYKLPYRNSKRSQEINERLLELVKDKQGTKKETEILQKEFPDMMLNEQCIQDRKQRLGLITKTIKDNWDLQIEDIKLFIKQHSYYSDSELIPLLKQQFNLTDDECRENRVHGFRKQYIRDLKKKEDIMFDENTMNKIEDTIRNDPHKQPSEYAKILKLNVYILEQYLEKYNNEYPDNKLLYADKNRNDLYEFIDKHPNQTLIYYQTNAHAERLKVKEKLKEWEKNNKDKISKNTTLNKKGKYEYVIPWLLLNPKAINADCIRFFDCSKDVVSNRRKKINQMSEEEKQQIINEYKDFDFKTIL